MTSNDFNIFARVVTTLQRQYYQSNFMVDRVVPAQVRVDSRFARILFYGRTVPAGLARFSGVQCPRLDEQGDKYSDWVPSRVRWIQMTYFMLSL